MNCENVSLGGEYPSVRISTEATCGSTHPSFSDCSHNEQDDFRFSPLKACEQFQNISAAISSEPNPKFNMRDASFEIPPISPIKLEENSNFRENPMLSSQFPEDQNQIHSSGHPSPYIAKNDSHESFTQFTIPKDIPTIIDEKKWEEIFSDTENWLPYNWSDVIANLLSQFLPHCCLNFKGRKPYPTKSQFIGKFWISCSIAGYNLESNAVLLKSRLLIITNKYMIKTSQGSGKKL